MRFNFAFQQVAVMLIIQQAINHFQEALLPFVILQWYTKWQTKLTTKMEKGKRAKKAVYTTYRSCASFNDSQNVATEPTEIEELDIDDPLVQKAISESAMDPYEVSIYAISEHFRFLTFG